jgi:molybdenum cofactor guanylyltransferase
MEIAGIIACGGLSTRMKADKSLLTYHAGSQRKHLLELLQPFCSEVFLSMNQSQSEPEFEARIIFDVPAYANAGPLTALLSVASTVKSDAYLLIGCDYPLLRSAHSEQLIKNHQTESSATCFGNDNHPEPLLAIYSGELVEKIFIHADKSNSLYQFLINSNSTIIDKPKELFSADTPEQFFMAKQLC